MIWLSGMAAVTAAGLVLVAVWVWRQIHEIQERIREQRDAQYRTAVAVERLAPKCEQLSGSVSDLEARFEEVAAYAGACVPPRPLRSGLNVSLHARAMELHRDGIGEFEIASELGMAVGEIRLLIHLSENVPQRSASRKKRECPV